MVSEKSIMRCTFIQHRGASMHQKSQQGKQRNCLSEFLILSAPKLPLNGEVFLLIGTRICLQKAGISKHS